MNDHPTTRRVFLWDIAFLGGSLLASIAWAWANANYPTPPQPPLPDKTRPPEFNTPTGSPAILPRQPSPKPRPPEFDHEQVKGELHL